MPFFMVTFYEPDTKQPVSACPRGLLKRVAERLESKGLGAMAGGELFFPMKAVSGRPLFKNAVHPRHTIHEKSDRNRCVKRSTSFTSSARQTQIPTNHRESAIPRRQRGS